MKAKESERKRAKVNYQWCKERGICVYCRKNPAAPDRTLCPGCHARVLNRKHEREQAYTAKGICYQCRENPFVPGHRICQDCLNKNAETSYKYYIAAKERDKRERHG